MPIPKINLNKIKIKSLNGNTTNSITDTQTKATKNINVALKPEEIKQQNFVGVNDKTSKSVEKAKSVKNEELYTIEFKEKAYAYQGFHVDLTFIRPFVQEGVLFNENTQLLDALNLSFLDTATSGANWDATFKDIKGKWFGDDNEDQKSIAEDITKDTDNTSLSDKIGSFVTKILDTATSIAGNFLIGSEAEEGRGIEASIRLPLPNDLPSDNINVKWDAEDQGWLGSLYNKHESTGTYDSGAIANVTATNLEDTLLKDQKDNIVGFLFETAKTSSKIRSMRKGLRQGQDMDVVLLKGIDRRTINLEWSFIPSNETEMKSIMTIANVIKNKILPSNTANSFGITYPSYVQLGIFLGHKLYYYIEEGVVSNFEILFPQASNGIWRTDNAPSEITLKMTIMDRRRMYAEDYGYGNSEENKIAGSQGAESFKKMNTTLSDVPNYISNIIKKV